MKRAILFLTLCIAPSAMAAQAPVTQITGITASREALRTQVNTRLSAAQSNFTEIYTALNGAPWLAQTTAPNTYNVFWIDTSGTSSAVKYWDGDSWEVAASGGDGTYTLPTASAETKGGARIGARLTMTGDVLSADVQTTDISGKEDSLGNPSTNGYVLSSTTAGIRSWVNLAGVFAAPLGSDDNYVTDAEKIKLGSLSGTNTGDQDLSGYALISSVLSKTNTTAFTPTADYHPATKKYVDDSITASGGYTDEQAQDAAGVMFSGNTETGITVTYDDATGKVNFVVPTTLAGFTDDSTHRVVTDTQIGTWNAKQNTLIAGTDYLAPTGIGAGLTFTATGFNGNLATTTNTVQELADAVDDLPGGSDDQTAAEVPITDSGGYYTATTVEGALAERGADPLIHWDTATITEVENSPVAGTNTISVKAGVFQAYDADWLGITANGASLVSTSYAGMKTLLDTDDIQTLTGIPAGTAHLGTFTGSTIPDSSTIKVGMQALETAVEGKQNTIAANTYQAYDANMILWPSTISATEVGYIDGLGGPLTTLLGAKLDDSQLDDTKGNGDTGYIWSADKVFDLLALKRSITDERESIGWHIKDTDVVTAVADGKQGAVIPESMNGMVLVGVTCKVDDLNSAASGTTTVVLRRVRGATAVDMTSTGITIGYNEYAASDEVVDMANDDVVTGDTIFPDVNTVTSPAHKGLGCTADFARQ